MGIISWPTGTKVDIQALFSTGVATCAILVWTLENVQSATPVDTASASSGIETPLTVGLDLYGGGGAVCGASQHYFGAAGWTLVGATEVADSTGVSAAQLSPDTGEGGHTITAYPTNPRLILLAASFS